MNCEHLDAFGLRQAMTYTRARLVEAEFSDAIGGHEAIDAAYSQVRALQSEMNRRGM